MSASTNTVPAQMGFGRLPSAFAALALVIILAVAVAIVALGSTKAAPLAESGAKGAPPPAFIDHGWSGVTIPSAVPVVPTVPFNDHGWSSAQYYGPAFDINNSKDDTYVRQPAHDILPGRGMRPQ